MKAKVSLYKCGSKASDGSSVSRKVTQEWLDSSDYQQLIKTRMGLGGITHKDRQVLDESLKSVIASEDGILLNTNSTHFFTKVYLTDDDWCCAEIEFFEEDDMDEVTGEKLKHIKGLLRKGVKLPVSSVIRAHWNMREEAESIVRIKGCDFTLDPAFSNSEILEVYE